MSDVKGVKAVLLPWRHKEPLLPLIMALSRDEDDEDHMNKVRMILQIHNVKPALSCVFFDPLGAAKKKHNVRSS